MVKNGRHLERAGRVSSVRQREEGCHPSPRRRSVFPPLYLPLTRARSAESMRGVGEVEGEGGVGAKLEKRTRSFEAFLPERSFVE